MKRPDIEAHRQIAERATPGPWTREKPKKDADGWRTGVAIAGTPGRQVIWANPPGGQFPDSDATFIATFDPPTVLAYMDYIAYLEQVIADRG